ncbi:MAG: DUF2085 domain-containing protein [Candidatus Thorarchaeota archaeon]|nr:DUF2085 domain-containing protein [Candidatus Thorarchaeota archaeon]
MMEISEQTDPYSTEDELEFDAYAWTRKDEIKETMHTLISHHPPSLYSHCMRVSIFGRSLYFCSRCTGIYGGMGIGVIAIFLLGINLSPPWLWFMIALILGFSTVTDWMTQRISPRKTRNSVRFVTGAMSGLGLAIVFLLADLLFMLITLGIMVASVGIVGILENRLIRASQVESSRAIIDEEDDDDISELPV